MFGEEFRRDKCEGHLGAKTDVENDNDDGTSPSD